MPVPIRVPRPSPSALVVVLGVLGVAAAAFLAVGTVGHVAGKPGVVVVVLGAVAAAGGLFLRYLVQQSQAQADALAPYAPRVRPLVEDLAYGGLHHQVAPFRHALGAPLRIEQQIRVGRGGSALLRVLPVRGVVLVDLLSHPEVITALADYWGLPVRVHPDPGNRRAAILEIGP
ncbi:hypothetical protein [Nocardia wallacei]|uniref:hypothetical protein n=1 Tax=Nocardia wallacei TaxID=480035 RepID=UPI002458FE32|nr:hypothetical protein [Nocardia wallacei]